MEAGQLTEPAVGRTSSVRAFMRDHPAWVAVGVLVGVAGLVELARWQTQPLAEHVVAFDVAAVAANIGKMGNGAYEGDDLALVEDGGYDHEVWQMTGPQPGVVGKKHIAFL